MRLAGKRAVVFGATGGIGSAVARTFAREGATVFLSSRNANKLERLSEEIANAGRQVHSAVIDATNEEQVRAYVAQIVAEHGRIDSTFNAIGQAPSDLGYPAITTTQPLEDFWKPLQVILGSTFITSRVVGAHMQQQGGGAIITLSATLSIMTAPLMAGISATCSAIEGLTRSLAGEFGPANIRVNCVRANGMPETRTIQETGAGYIRLGYPLAMALPPLGRPISTNETAAAVAFLASDAASGITGEVLTISAGAFPVG